MWLSRDEIDNEKPYNLLQNLNWLRGKLQLWTNNTKNTKVSKTRFFVHLPTLHPLRLTQPAALNNDEVWRYYIHDLDSIEHIANDWLEGRGEGEERRSKQVAWGNRMLHHWI